MSNVTVNSHLVQDALLEATEMIKAGIDLEKVKRVIQGQLRIGTIVGIDLQEVEAVVFEGKLAFHCKMTANSNLVMILDCNGNCKMAFPEKEETNPSYQMHNENHHHQAAESYSQ